jgi:hypothetical protein
MFRCDSTTPFGLPVLPEVYRIAAMSASIARRQPGLRRGAAHQHRAQVRAARQRGVQLRQALGGGDQHPHVAVGQDVRHLLGLEQRIDRDEHGAGQACSEHRRHVLDALVEVDGDALATPDAAGNQRAGGLLDRAGQRRVVEPLSAMHQRFGAGRTACGIEDEIVDQVRHRGMGVSCRWAS